MTPQDPFSVDGLSQAPQAPEGVGGTKTSSTHQLAAADDATVPGSIALSAFSAPTPAPAPGAVAAEVDGLGGDSTRSNSGRVGWRPQGQFPTIIALIFVVLFLIGLAASGFILLGQHKDKTSLKTLPADYAVTSITISKLLNDGAVTIDSSKQLSVNGQLQINNSAVISPGEEPLNPKLGQLYLSSADQQLYYYDGSQFVNLADTSQKVTSLGGLSGDIALGQGFSTAGGVLTNTAATGQVISVQGQTGAVSFTSGGGIAINGLTISNTGVTSISGTSGEINVSQATGSVTLSLPQSIATSATPTFAGLNLGSPLSVTSGGSGGTAFTANGVLLGNGSGGFLTTTTGTAGQCFRSNGAAAPSFQPCPGGGGAGVISSGVPQTAGTITKFDITTNQIVDSLLTESGSVVTVNGDLNVTGTIGTAGSTLTLTGNSSSAFVLNGTNVSAAEFNILDGGIDLSAETAGNYVATITAGGGLTGDVSTHGSTPTLAVGPGNGITVNPDNITLNLQASKGLEVDSNGLSLVDCANGEILKYNGSNQWACATDSSGSGIGGSGTLNKVAKFGAGGTSIGDSTITDDGTNVSLTGDLTLQGGDMTLGTTSVLGTLVLHDGNGDTTTLQAGDSTGNLSFTLPTTAGGSGECIKSNGSGVLSFGACLSGSGGGGGVTAVNSFSGSVSIQGTTNQIAVNNSAGTITLSTPQDIATTSAPTFGGLTATGTTSINASGAAATNLGTGTGAVSAGNTTGTLTLTGNSSSAFVLNGTNVSAAEFNILDGGIDLSAETAGNYVATITAGGGLTGDVSTHGSTPTLAVASSNDGIKVNADDIQLALQASGNGLSNTTQSGSGLEILNNAGAGGLTLLQGCADGEILKWDETNDLWKCAADGVGTSSNSFQTINAPSGTDPIASSSTDTLNLTAAGTNLTITGNAGTKTIDFDVVESVLAGNGLAVNGDALDVSVANGIQIVSDAVQVNQNFGFAWTGQQSWTNTVTADGSIADFNLTLGNDTDADTVSAVNIDVTSAATGDADIVYGLNVGNLTNANATVLEQAIRVGSGWDNIFDINGTLISAAEFNILDGGIDLSAETAGNYVATITAGGGLTGDVSTHGSTPTLAVGPGNGITVNPDDIAVNLLASTDGTGGTSTNSGLEFQGASNNQLTLLQGCGNNEILKWNDSTNVWACAADADSGSTLTLQNAYNNSTSPEIVVDGTLGALTIRDASTPIGANLLEVQNNTGSSTYLAVTSSGISVSGNIQTGGTNRIDNSGNLVNIGNITGTGGVTLQATTGTLALVVTGANPITFTTNGSQRLQLDSSGGTFTNDVAINGGNLTSTAGTFNLLSSTTGTAINLGTGLTTGSISLGGASQTGAITLGQSTDTNTINIGNATIATTKTGTINIGTNATGTGKTTVTIGSSNDGSGVTLQGGTGNINLNAGTIATNATTLNLFNTTATTISLAGAATTLNIGPTGASGSILLSGGSTDTGCTLNGVNGDFACTGNITGASTGTAGYWSRAATTLQPATAGDSITTSGSISTTAAGTITSAGLLTASAGLTVAANQTLNLTGGVTGNRPVSPSEGMVYYDTTTKRLLVYSNGKWQADRSASSAIVAATNSSQTAKDNADYVADGEDSSGSGIGTLDGDQGQINNALSAVSTGGGGTVYLMEGTYTIDASISIPNNVTLAGSGGNSLIQLGNFGATAVSIDSIVNTDTSTGTRVGIRDLRLDGRSSINTNGTQRGVGFTAMGGGSGASARDGAKLTNVWAKNFRNEGFYLTSSRNNTLSGNTSQNNLYGFYLSSSLYNALSNNLAQANSTYGITLSGGSNNTVTGNTLEGNGSGVTIISASIYNTVTGNTAVGGTYGFSLNGANTNTLTGNNAQNNSTNGIYVTSASSNVITGNQVSLSGTAGISLDTLSNTNTISGNAVDASGGATTNNGIRLDASDSNTIVSNTVTDASCSTNCYAINISNSTSDTNYLASNTYNSPAVINDVGTSTIYGSQLSDTNSIILQGPGSINVAQVGAGSGSLSVTGGYYSSQIATPSAPTVTRTGASTAATWGYKITVVDGIGETAPSTEATRTNAATLDGSNFNTITWTRVPGATSYKIYRTTSGGTPASLGLICTVAASATTLSCVDNNVAANAVSAPIINTTGSGFFAGQLISKSTINTAGEFQVQNATSGVLLNADTTTSVNNLITNSSFETATTGWAAVGGTTTIGQDPSQYYNGSKSLNITTSATAQTGAKYVTGNGTGALAISSTYTISWYDKLASGTFTDVIAAYSRDGTAGAGETSCTGINTQTVTTTGWTRHTCQIVTTASAPTSAAYVIIKQGATATARTFYIDAVQLELAASASAYNNGTITINGSLVVGDGSSLTVLGGATATRPASPTEGMVYYDTTTKQLLTYANSKWQADRSTATKIVGTSASGGTSSAVASQNPDGADFVNASTTSAQTVINSAISALPAGGGTVYLMEGTYIIDGSITLPANVTLSGAGSSTIIKLKNSIGTTLTGITQSGTPNRAVISNLKLDGNKTNNLIASGNQDGISIAGGNPGVKINSVLVEQFNHYGITITSASNGSISNSTIVGNGSSATDRGIYLGSSTSYYSITGNAIQGNAGLGILLNLSSANNTITGNTVQGNSGTGISMFSSNNTISSNTVSGNVDGIELQSSQSTVIGNTITSNTGNGISLSSNGNTITGNLIVSSGLDGISTVGASTNNIVSDNRIIDSGSVTAASNGISVAGGSNYTNITNNYITDSGGTGYAISITSGTNTYLSGNTYSGTGASSINESGTGTIFAGQLNGAINSSYDYVLQGASRTLTQQDFESTAMINTAYGGIGQFGNLLTYSEQLEHANWGTYTNVTRPATAGTDLNVTTAAGTAPDGQTTAELLNASGAGTVAQTSGTAVGGTAYVFSIWLKSTSTTTNRSVNIQIVGSGSGTCTAKSLTVTPTWQRFYTAACNTSAFTGSVRVVISQAASSDDIYAWGAQLIAGSSPGAYVRSTASSVAASSGVVSNGGLFVSSINASDKPLVIQGAVSQSGNLLELQNSSGAVLSSFAADGSLSVPKATITSVTNSTTAFQVQNAVGSTALSVDTTSLNSLIVNGNAEGTDISAWASKQNATVTRDSTESYIGSNSIKTVLGGSPAANDGVKYTPSPVLSASTYSLSFYMKQTAGTAFSTNLAVGWNNGSTDGTACTLSPTLTNQPVPTTGWARYTCTFTGSASGHIYWKQTDTPGSARTFFIDGLQLELASSSKPFKETGLSLNGVISSPMALQNTSDSTTAFQIQNAAGTSNLFIADTLNGKVGIGMAPLSTSSAVLQVSGDIDSGGGNVLGSSIIANNNFTAASSALNTGQFRKCVTIGTGGVSANHVVILANDGGTAKVMETTTARDVNVYGVAMATCTGGAAESVAFEGMADVTATTAGAVNIGDQLVTSTTAGQVKADNTATSGILGIALTAKAAAASGTVSVNIRPVNGHVDTTYSAFTSTASVVARFDRSNDGSVVEFASGGVVQGDISIAGATVSYNAFTGSHYALSSGAVAAGEIVTNNGIASYLHGASAGEPLYEVSQTAVPNDPHVLGSYLQRREPSKPLGVDNPDLITAVGNGDVWLVDNGQPVAAGTNLISSDVAGHAMADPGTYPVSHVFAKVAENVDWDGVTATIDGRKHRKVSVFYGFFDKTNNMVQNQNLTANTLQAQTASLGNLNVSGTATVAALTVTGTASVETLVVNGNATFQGDIMVNGHIVTGGGAPNTQIQTAAGAGASVSVSGTDSAGTITITTGSNPAAGELAKILFAKHYGAKPRVVLSPANEAASELRYFKGTTTIDDFMLNAKDVPGANTTFEYDYIIAQ